MKRSLQPVSSNSFRLVWGNLACLLDSASPHLFTDRGGLSAMCYSSF